MAAFFDHEKENLSPGYRIPLLGLEAPRHKSIRRETGGAVSATERGRAAHGPTKCGSKREQPQRCF